MSKWTQQQRDNACTGLAQQGLEVGGRAISDGNLELVIDLACQRNELLEALRRLVTDCSDYEAWARPCLAYDKASAAIAKAEGK